MAQKKTTKKKPAPKKKTTRHVIRKLPTADRIPVHCSHSAIVDIESVVPNPRNPNQHPEGQVELLAKIIRGQGWRNPIVISSRSGFVVKGHGRLLAAQHLAVSQVPVDVQDYASEASEHADLIADNRIAELAEIDPVELRDLLASIDFDELDGSDMTGFIEGEIEALMAAGSDIDPDMFSDLDAQAAALSGKAPNLITIEVPLEHVDKVCKWLANGEQVTAPGMGKGVMSRCGLL